MLNQEIEKVGKTDFSRVKRGQWITIETEIMAVCALEIQNGSDRILATSKCSMQKFEMVSHISLRRGAYPFLSPLASTCEGLIQL